MIIDSHLHLPPINGCRNFQESKLKLLSEMDRAGIDYGIIIPDNLEDSNIGDLNTVLNITEKNENLFALGVMDIQSHEESWIKKLKNHFEEGEIKGIKIFPGHDPVYPTDERFEPLYELCIKYDYPLVIHTGPSDDNTESSKYNDPKYIVKIAKEFPKLKIIIAHYFWPEIEYCYRITRGFDNIHFDTSALADKEVLNVTGEKKMKNVLRKTVADNPESVLFGTDFSMCDFDFHLDLINSLNLPDNIRKRIFWKNASQLFSLN